MLFKHDVVDIITGSYYISTYLELSFKATLPILFFVQVVNGHPELVGNHASVSTGDVVIQSIMN